MQEGTNSLRKLRRDWWKTKLCTACVSPLGRFLSRGGTCPQCSLRVCKQCRIESPSGTWVCILCSSGQMPSDELTKTTKSLGRDSRSIRRSWTISNPHRAETNSPILKAYTVLNPEDAEASGSGDSIGDPAPGCSVSTGHLSFYKDDRHAPTSGLGGSDHHQRGISLPTFIGLSHHHHHQGDGVNRKNTNHGSNGADDDDEDDVNSLGSTSARQFHFNSLPRMSSNPAGGLSLFAPSSGQSPAVARVLGLGKRSCKPEKDSIKRHRSFQSTLFPYNPPVVASSQNNNPPPSPATSVKFIEDAFWDYYDEIASDPDSTPRNLRKSATAAAISDLAAEKHQRPGLGLDSNSNTTNISNNRQQRYQNPNYISNSNQTVKPSAFRTDSNRSSCERSVGDTYELFCPTMSYDSSLRLNHFSSSDNDLSKYDENKDKHSSTLPHPSSSSTSAYRRYSNDLERSPRTGHYATLAAPYLPASEYVYRRKHPDEMLNETPPPKPERKSRTSKRSMSLNAYDGRKLFSPLKTYCVLMKENIEPENKPEKTNVNENNTYHSSTYQNQDYARNTNPNAATTSASPAAANSAIWNHSSSPISLSLSTSSTAPLKFNSLPRERYIRIEREDGDGSINVEKYSSLKYPSRKNELLLGKSGTMDHYPTRNPISSAEVGDLATTNIKGRNVTRVPIVKDDNHIDSFPTHRTTFSSSKEYPSKNKIERSQSHREISGSRPYPFYHHYHPQQQHLNSQNNMAATIPRESQYQRLVSGGGGNNSFSPNSADKQSAKADLNFMAAGTTTTLPTNFRTKGKPAASSSLSVWDDSSRQQMREVDRPSNFFHSDFDDGSDVVIENFIKTHSSGANSASNTLPKRKYPPSTTQIGSSNGAYPQQQRRASDNTDYLYHHDAADVTVSNNKSDFKETTQRDHSPSDNYLRQCSTFPRGMSQRSKQFSQDKDTTMDSTQQTEQLPNFYKNTNSTAPRNNASNSFSKGYPCHDELDVFFHPTTANTSSSKSKEFENVPNKHANGSAEERILPIKIASLTAGSGFSATLPHPYIRRKARESGMMTNGAEKAAGGIDSSKEKRETMQNGKNPGSSISQVEMDIERDIFYQKTKSLDRVKPSSKSRLKSVLSLGRGNNNQNHGASTDNSSTNAPNQQFPPMMEIDYSDSQPYNNNPKSRLHHEKLLSIDQVDRNYANTNTNAARSNEAVGILNGKSITSDLLQPQQIHHANASSNGNSSTAAPIPSPRLKRKAKLNQQPNALYSPKINGDEMSSSASKSIGPGTNKPQFPSNSNTVAASRLLLNEQPHDTRVLNGAKPNATNNKSSTNPISFGSSSQPSASGDSKLTLSKETSIKPDHLHYPNHHHSAFIGANTNTNGVDGTIKSEKQTGANHISQPSSGSVTPNFANSDSPGANFMISTASAPATMNNNSALSITPSTIEFELEQQEHSSSSPSGSNSKTKAMSSEPQSQIKSALANKLASASKAVRFEPHVIAMEMEKQQQMSNQQHPVSGTASITSTSTNGNLSGINSQPGSVVVDGAGLKSGNLMHRHGHPHHHANKASRHSHQHPHYVHASSYLPVIYHSYHQNHNHKYIRKGASGASGSISGAGNNKSGKKSKKYKGFVARAIAKVKNKAIKKDNGSSTINSAPTVYIPVGKQPGNGNAKESVITYISPHPTQHHPQPPEQLEIESVQHSGKNTVPSITVSLTSIEAPLSANQSVSPSGEETKKYHFTPGGKHTKNSKLSKGPVAPHHPLGPRTSSQRRMDGYTTENFHSIDPHLYSAKQGTELDESGNGPIPDSFHLQSDRITPSSTSSSSSSFTSNLQESYELFHNQTLLPDNGHEENKVVATATTSAISDRKGDCASDDQEYDSLNEDEDSDNANCEEDGAHIFKSFDESDFEEDEEEDDDDEPDFVFYPTPSGSSNTNANNDVEFNAPFAAHNNETTTKGSTKNNKGKSSVEPKMGIHIPTYRSPNNNRSTRLINSHSHHYGKFPNANPTVVGSLQKMSSSNAPASLSKPKENVKQTVTTTKPFSSSSTLNEPHPSAVHMQSTSNNADNNANPIINPNQGDISFGSHKTSQQHCSRQTTAPADVTNFSTGLQLSSRNATEQNANSSEYQVNLDHDTTTSQPFVPFHDKNNGCSSKGRPYSRRDHHNAQSEHERNDDDDDDHHHHRLKDKKKDTLQKDYEYDDSNDNAVKATRKTDAGSSYAEVGAANNVADSGTPQKYERVYPPNAKDFKISTSSQEAIASAKTSTGSTQSNNQNPSSEGRLSDLTTPATSTTSHNHGQHSTQGLRYGPSAKSESPNKNTTTAQQHQDQNLIIKKSQDGGDSLLQARNSQSSSSSTLPLWASNSAASGSSNIINGTSKENHNHNTVTNQTQNDVERLQRLELVKRQQQNILTHINNSTTSNNSTTTLQDQQQKGNFNKSGSDFSNALLECYHLAQTSPAISNSNEQLNSLETQCANDQSFLSESEVGSSCGGGGKSPSPSPRFKPKKFGFKAGRIPQQIKSGESKIPREFRKCADGDDTVASGSHLLNNQQSKKRSQEGKQSKSENVVKQISSNIAPQQREAEEESHSISSDQEERDSPLFYPDSGRAGPGMSILPSSPQQSHPHTKSTTTSAPLVEGSGNVGKFKSRILLNSDDLEDDEELSRAIADVTVSASQNKNGHGVLRAKPGKKNITTVEISGDVGIVTNNNVASSGALPVSSSSSNSKHNTSISTRQRPAVSSDHLQSSGLSLIQKPQFVDLHSSSEDEEEKPIKPEIKPKLLSRLHPQGPFVLCEEEEEVGGSVSANESCGDNDTGKTSDDTESSDWQSESTNTVIFRGNPQQSSKADETLFYGNSYLDPEIQINNITVSGEDEPVNSGSPPGKVNVGYKANKVNKVSTDLIIGIKKSSTDNTTANKDDDGCSVTRIGSKRKFDKGNDVSSSSSSSSSAVDSSEELGKSNETLTDIPINSSNRDQVAPGDEQTNLEVEMVLHPDKKLVNGNRLYVQNSSATKGIHHRRESPEGQEQEVPDPDKIAKVGVDTELASGLVPNAKEKKMEEGGGGDNGGGGGTAGGGDHTGGKTKKHAKSIPRGTISKEKILQNVLNQIPSRSSPDGADKSDRDATPEPQVESPSPAGNCDNFDVTSDEDSWVEEILFEDEDDTSFEEAIKKPPPLDLTLHTIVEESCEDSEAENSGNFYQPSTSGLGGSQKNTSLSQSDSNANELERYFNFGIYTDSNSASKNSLPNEESEFSDTFSESSFSLQEDEFDHRGGHQEGLLDPAELASTRLEKYFYNLGGPQAVMNTLSSTMMTQNADSDSVGSESDSDNSVLEKRKKVLKHHRRSADFEEEFGDKISDEEDSLVFGQDGFDTIKKSRKTKKSGSEGSLDNGSGGSGMNQGSTGTLTDKAESDANPSSSTSNNSKSLEDLGDSESSSKKTSPNEKNEKPTIKVNRSNSFQWSSDEEVNIMMSKLRQLIKNLIKSKTDAAANNASGQSRATDASSGNSSKDKQLVYLENELIRLMKTDNLKNIVEYLSSEESDVDDVYKFIKVVNSAGSTPVDLDDLGDLGELDIDDPNLLENLHSTMQLQQDGTIAPGASPKSSPALLAKVMHHIGNRLNMWMKDEGNVDEDKDDDNATLKCAPSVSSDLNEDRFSWKGSFESALAAKRQSVGSTDSISSSDYGQDKSMLRSSSLHHLTTSQPIEENKEEEEITSSLPRMTNLCNSLPRLNQPNNPAISRAHSLVMAGGKNDQQQQSVHQPGNEIYPATGISGPVKSARYRPPGFQPSMKSKRIDTEEKASPGILSQSTPVLTQDPAVLKNRSDSMGSIVHDVKPVISVKGQVEFGLQYNYKCACLEVKVVGCRDLAAADSKRNRSDPYVKAYLLPDKSKAGKRKTKTKKNTLNPLFDEILKFPLTLSDLQKRTLWLSVWHSDMFGKNEFLGEILVPLKDRVFDDPNPGWWDLQEMSGQMEDMPKGDVVIALKWTPKTDSTGNLSVLVKEAKNLVPVKNGSPSTFVKCALLSDKTRKQKTSICRRNFNPVWNQTLLFEDVDDDGIEITIWNHDLLASHDLIGSVRLEYDNPLWESMLSRPSFWVEGGLKLS